MGPVAYFSLCLLGCLIFNPSLAATARLLLLGVTALGELSPAAPPQGTVPSLSARAKAVSCPTGWLFFKHNCYGYFPQEKTWMEAEVECQHHWHGAHLVSIHSTEENKRLANYIKQNHKKESAVWIGLSDPEHNDSWRWTDHSLVSFTAWDEGQPNNFRGRERCVGSHPGKEFHKWHDYPCDHRHAFVCKHGA